MDEEDKILFQKDQSSADAYINIYKTYIESDYPKLRASGYAYFGQQWLLASSPNYEKAIKSWQLALKCSSNPIALYNLGVHFYLGKGIEQDFKSASDLFEKGAHMNKFVVEFRNFGVQESCYALGKCYENGTGRDKDLDLAKEWYFKAKSCNCGCYPSNILNFYGVSDRGSIDFLYYFQNPQPTMCREVSIEGLWMYEEEIKQKADIVRKGFCENLFLAMNELAQGNFAIDSYFADEPEITQREKVDIVQQEIIHLIANAIRWSPIDVHLCSKKMWNKLENFINSNFSRPLDDMTNTSILDRDTRILKLMNMARLLITGRVATENWITFLRFLEQSKSKYPNELVFHRADIVFHLYGQTAELRVISAFYNFPKHPDILFWRAHFIGRSSVDNVIKINAYWELIEILPIDHMLLPHAFYEMARFEGLCGNLTLCMCYYNQGLHSETNQLLFHLPYQSQAKNLVSIMLRNHYPV